MKTAISIILGLLIPAGLFAQDTAAGLRLDVFAFGGPVADIHSFVTNISGKPITVPTKAYGDGWSWSATGEGTLTFGLYIGSGKIGQMKVIPSPARFFPVTLLPGESTELTLLHGGRAYGDAVEVFFNVEKEYADRFGWWSGKLSKKVKIDDGPNPENPYSPVPYEEPDLPRKETKQSPISQPMPSTTVQQPKP